jgi:hypothetical protein
MAQANPIIPFGSNLTVNSLIAILQTAWKNLVSLVINGHIGFGDGSKSDNIDGVWVSISTPGSINTDFTVTHNLGRVPVGYLAMTKSAACDLYNGSIAWTSTQMTLRATTAGVTINLFVI